MASEEAEKVRRVYGRGYIDGLRHAEKQVNPAKLRQLEEGLNGYARKVLNAIPISEAWTLVQITAELRRTGANVDRHVLDGCMSALRESKLIREVSTGRYTRTEAKVYTPPPEPKVVVMPAAPVSPKPLERLAKLAEQMRALANEAEEIALEIEVQAQQNVKENEKLQRLRELLKDLNG